MTHVNPTEDGTERLAGQYIPVLALALVSIIGGRAVAATWTVGASGCDFTTIQAAIDDAGTGNGDTIQVLDATHTEAGIDVSKSVTIEGSGADQTIVQAHAVEGSASNRVFRIQSGTTVTILDMTVRHGKTWMDAGAIYNQGTLTMERCVICNNTVDTHDIGRGGGIYNVTDGTMTLVDCTIADNSSTMGEGGGIFSRGTTTLVGCTISGNEDRYVGGGIGSSYGTIVLTNCTISGNTSYWEAGGISSLYQASISMTITNCTITNNTCGSGDRAGGIYVHSGTVTLANSIVAGNTGGTADVEGTFTSSGYNLIGDNSGASGSFPDGSPNGNDDWVGTSGSPIDPLLAVLADNGGPTLTHALGETSPAVDKIPNGTNGMGTDPLDVDQRGQTRPALTSGDIGAFELQSGAPTVTTASVSDVTASTAQCGGNVTDDNGESVTVRGVCWSTSEDPTTDDSKTEDGSGTGAFVSSITGLTPGETYHVRAYATNANGTGYGSDVEFTTTVTVTASGGSAGFTVDGDAAVVDPGLTVDAATVDGFKVSITANFAVGDVLAYTGTLPGGVGASYDSDRGVLTFTGSADAADWQALMRTVTFSTTSGSADTRTVAFTMGGAIPFDDNGHFYEFVTSEGIGFNAANTAAGNRTLFGLQGYLVTVTSADENAFVSGKLAGEGWMGASDGAEESIWRWVTGPEGLEDSGNGRHFYTQTSAASNSGNLNTVYGGNTPGGGDAIGGEYNNWQTGEANDYGASGEDYAHFRSDGTWNDYPETFGSIVGYVVEYGGMAGDPTPQITDARDVTVTQLLAPTVTTASVSDLGATSASCGGNVTSDGGAAVTARGVCWSTSEDPTVADSNTVDGAGTGEFVSSITGLNPNTTYHVRAYATNGVDTSYGADVSFTTDSVQPILHYELEGNAEDSSGNGRHGTVQGTVSYAAGYTGQALSLDGNGWVDMPSDVIRGNPTLTVSLRFKTTAYGGILGYQNEAAENGWPWEYVPILAVVPPDGSPEGATGKLRAEYWTTAGGLVVLSENAVNDGNWHQVVLSATPTKIVVYLDGTFLGEQTGNINHLSMQYNQIGTARIRVPGGADPWRRFTGLLDDIVITTDYLPIVTTEAPTDVGTTTATGNGNITNLGNPDPTQHGVCWSTSQNPTVADDKTEEGPAGSTGPFTSAMADLSAGTTYHVRAYATNIAGTAYGSDVEFTTDTTATVTTTAISNITGTTASSGGNVTSDGGVAVTTRGVCWGTSEDPTTADDKTEDGTGTGEFVSSLTGLTPGTTYHVRAYATNGEGTSYGADVEFTTSATTPTVTTAVASSVTATTASSGGNVTDDGGADVTARGVCWGTSANPTTADDETEDGTGTGSFTSDLTGLSPDTTYHVRAYATNSQGTAYGADVSLTTSSEPVVTEPPTVTTATVSDVGTTTATSGGNVTDDGGAAVTARGVCWSTLADPTVADSKTEDGTGEGSFVSELTGLDPNTTYYVRAYASNDEGTSYGEAVSFEIVATAPRLEVTVSSEPGVDPDPNTASDPNEDEGTTQATVGEDVTFYVDVENVGNADAGNVVVTIPLPENTEFVSGRILTTPTTGLTVPGQVTVADGIVTIEAGDIPPGQNVKAEVVVKPIASGDVSMTASAECQDAPEPVVAAEIVEVQDVYDQVVTTERPSGFCGAVPVLPAALLVLLVGRISSRRQRKPTSS